MSHCPSHVSQLLRFKNINYNTYKLLFIGQLLLKQPYIFRVFFPSAFLDNNQSSQAGDDFNYYKITKRAELLFQKIKRASARKLYTNCTHMFGH